MGTEVYNNFLEWFCWFWLLDNGLFMAACKIILILVTGKDYIVNIVYSTERHALCL